MTCGGVYECTYHSALVYSVTTRVMNGFSFEQSALVVAIIVLYCEKMCNSGNLVALAGSRAPCDLGKCDTSAHTTLSLSVVLLSM